MSRNQWIQLAKSYAEKRLAGDVEGCVSLFSNSIKLDNSHGCDSGRPAVGIDAARERLIKHFPPRLAIEWTDTEIDESTKTVTLNGFIKQFTLKWYQRLEVTCTDDNKIQNIYWFGRVPVRDGEGCCI